MFHSRRTGRRKYSELNLLPGACRPVSCRRGVTPKLRRLDSGCSISCAWAAGAGVECAMADECRSWSWQVLSLRSRLLLGRRWLSVYQSIHGGWICTNPRRDAYPSIVVSRSLGRHCQHGFRRTVLTLTGGRPLKLFASSDRPVYRRWYWAAAKSTVVLISLGAGIRWVRHVRLEVPQIRGC